MSGRTEAHARGGLQERVVEGAFTAVAEHGWHGATLERIAAAAGVSRMTLHRHGIGRDEVFALLGAAYEDDFHAAVARASAPPGSGAERLRRALAAVCDVSERHLGFLRGLDEETDTRLFHVRGDEVRSRDAYVDPVAELLRLGVADGTLRPAPGSEPATLLVNAVDRTYRHLRIAHAWAPRRARVAVLDLVLRGVVVEVTARPQP